MRHLSTIARLATPLVLGLVTLAGAPRSSEAQELSTIREPSAHRMYPVELEPHFTASFVSPYDGIGVGGRFSVPVVRNGFVPSINNNVAIGFGLDWVHGQGCFPNNCVGHDSLWFPAVMQWNFFLTKHWSVFGEPGLAIAHSLQGGGLCPTRDVFGNLVYTDCGSTRTDLEPIFMAGARYHFADKFALTMRAGYPGISIGGSFM
jgi:hypothetical protein